MYLFFFFFYIWFIFIFYIGTLEWNWNKLYEILVWPFVETSNCMKLLVRAEKVWVWPTYQNLTKWPILRFFFFFFKGFLIGLITLQHLLKYTNNVTNLHTYTHNVQFILYAPTLTVFTVFAYHIYKINILKYFTKK